MSRWQRVIRGMLGMGLTFSAGVGVVASAVAGLGWLLGAGDGGPEMIRMVVASAMWAFPIGVAFSGTMALTARGRTFEHLSIPRFAALGAGAGLLLFGVLALNAWDAWSTADALVNAAILVGLGSGSAAASLVLARRAAPELEPGEDSRELGPGEAL